MKYRRLLIILGSLLFFLAAITFYMNRVLFPGLIKHMAVEQLEKSLKRKVEISSIHFNWFRGIIIDNIKIYEKGPDAAIFAQARQVSFGILFFPGLKHYRITIPFINVNDPSVHLVRTGPDTWNFSDIFASPTAPQTEKPPAFEIAWGGLTVTDGQCRLDDISAPRRWSEYFDNINLKLALSYKEIDYDFTADIPAKNGFIGATVAYQLLTQNTQAQIHLKNIDTASYLSLVDLPDVRLESGTIEEINLNITRAQESTSAQGDVLMKDLDITSHDQAFKGDIEIHNLDARYKDGHMTARGQMALNNVQTTVPGLAASGSVQARVNDLEMTRETAAFNGSLKAQNISVSLTGRLIQARNVSLDNINVRQNKDGLQSAGNMTTQGLFIRWPDQRIRGDITFKNVTLRMKDENDIVLQGGLEADNFSAAMGHRYLESRHLVLENTRMNILDEKDISLETGLSLEDMRLSGRGFGAWASVKTDKLLFVLNGGTINASATFTTSNGRLVLDNGKTIEADPQLKLVVQMPLKNPDEISYKGSITLSDAAIRGFVPLRSLDNVELDADFQNDQATINAFNADVLGTSVSASGTVHDFKKPFLNITAEADEFDLARIKDLAPRIVDRYGLEFNGTGSVKLKFEGYASDWASGKITTSASVRNASVSSSKLRQRIKNITGIIETSPGGLKWRDFTVAYQGQDYTLSGSLENFKHPSILLALNGPDLLLNADLTKNNDLITINALSGKYRNAAFDSTGIVTLLAAGPRFDIRSNATLLLENLVKTLPAAVQKILGPLDPTGTVNMTTELKGTSLDWKAYHLHAVITSPVVSLMGYNLRDIKISVDQDEGKVKDLTLDGKLYDGTVRAVGSLDLMAPGMPYEMALNIDNTDLHQLKMDSPLKMEEINGKFFLTAVAHGTLADFKNNLHATGSLAIRDGFLAEFNLFKGLLSVLNDALHLGQVMITDVEGNFTVENQKISTDNLRLKGPNIVLLTKGWVNFDQTCDLDVTVDLNSATLPDIARDVLKSLNIRIYDKIANPKFKQKISMPQVIDTLFKNILQ